MWRPRRKKGIPTLNLDAIQSPIAQILTPDPDFGVSIDEPPVPLPPEFEELEKARATLEKFLSTVRNKPLKKYDRDIVDLIRHANLEAVKGLKNDAWMYDS